MYVICLLSISFVLQKELGFSLLLYNAWSSFFIDSLQCHSSSRKIIWYSISWSRSYLLQEGKTIHLRMLEWGKSQRNLFHESSQWTGLISIHKEILRQSRHTAIPQTTRFTGLRTDWLFPFLHAEKGPQMQRDLWSFQTSYYTCTHYSTRNSQCYARF
jgi:hypothetical protein